MIIYVVFIVTIVLIIISLNYIIRSKNKKIFSDNPFECGIRRINSSRKPYSIPFFVYLLIFLLFDIEIILIFPLLYIYFSVNFLFFYLVIIFLLLLSLLIE